jgi:hypothetical protein
MRLAVLLVLAPAAVFAAAAPVRAQQRPPEVLLAKANPDHLLLTEHETKPVQKTEPIVIHVGTRQLYGTKTVWGTESSTFTTTLPYTLVRASEPGGKPIPEDRLKVLLKEVRLVVFSRDGPMAPEYRKLFRDDVVILEFVPPKKK